MAWFYMTNVPLKLLLYIVFSVGGLLCDFTLDGALHPPGL